MISTKLFELLNPKHGKKVDIRYSKFYIHPCQAKLEFQQEQDFKRDCIYRSAIKLLKKRSEPKKNAFFCINCKQFLQSNFNPQKNKKKLCSTNQQYYIKYKESAKRRKFGTNYKTSKRKLVGGLVPGECKALIFFFGWLKGYLIQKNKYYLHPVGNFYFLLLDHLVSQEISLMSFYQEIFKLNQTKEFKRYRYQR